MEFEWVDIDKIVPNPKNRNQHPDKQITRLAKLIEHHGWRHPLIVSKNSGKLVVGHGRLLAAKELGVLKVPVHYQEFADETEEFTFGVSDNGVASWAELDLEGINTDIIDYGPFDIDLLGINGFTIDAKYDHKEDEDDVPEIKTSKIKEGDLFSLGSHRLLCGDSQNKEHLERLMSGEKASLWLTDPPYGVGMQAREESSSSAWVNKDRVNSQITNDEKSLEEMTVFWKLAAEAAHSATSDTASYYWFACQGGGQMMMMMMLGEAEWQVKHELIWVKDQMCFGRADYHYKHEPIIYGWKRNQSHEWCGDRKQVSTFEIPRPKKSDLHPTMKPVELLESLLTNSSKEGWIVLDTFLGSGSTLIACEKTNRHCYGVEIDPLYCQTIISRWEEFTGKKVEKIV